MNLDNLKLDIDSESVSITHEEGEKITPIVYWHIDEVKEDENVAISMCNAVNLFHTDKAKLLELLNKN